MPLSTKYLFYPSKHVGGSRDNFDLIVTYTVQTRKLNNKDRVDVDIYCLPS